MPGSAFNVCACTIAAWPMYASAGVVARSFAAEHPEVPFVTLIADTRREDEPEVGPGERIFVSDLGRPDLVGRAFRADQQEFSYAVTAALIEHLLDRGHDAVLFYKQESLICGPQDTLIERLRRDDIVLTPHLLGPLPGHDGPAREQNILLSGVHNLGFLGVANRDEGRRFLGWWDARLDEHCRRVVQDGMHFEQRWVDLVPSLFDHVGIVRDPAFNVGHWNITERAVTASPDGSDIRVGSRRCSLIRFSGYDVDRPDRMTRYAERVTPRDIGSAASALDRYRRALLAAGWTRSQGMDYGYARWHDGVEIPDCARAAYRDLPSADRTSLGDPFAVGPGTFRDWLATPVDEVRPPITRLHRSLYERRPDLREAFPDLLGVSRSRFLTWVRSNREDSGLPVELEPVGEAGLALVTVSSAERLPQVAALARSLRRHHPDLVVHVATLDGATTPEPSEPGVTLLADLARDDPELAALRVSLRPMELAARTKPAAIRAMLDAGHDRVLYLDADTYVLDTLTPLLEAGRRHSVVLTPHRVAPPPKHEAITHELELLRAGTLNAGLVAVRADPTGLRFLEWWSDRMRHAAGFDPDGGVYHDQRWLDLAPTLFPDVHVFRDPRFNVAYWNLEERATGAWHLFHFSGIEPQRPDRLSRFRTPAAGDALERARRLAHQYVGELGLDGADGAGGEDRGGFGPAPFATFADAVAIPPQAGAILASLSWDACRFGNSLRSGAGSFREWLASPVDGREPAISHLWFGTHQLRADLREAFPDPLGADRPAFLDWCRHAQDAEYELDGVFRIPGPAG